MSRRKRKTVPQRIVGVATAGLPAPIQKRLSSRWGSLLVVILFPVLVAIGVLQISWNGWMPTVSVNRERASEVRQEIRHKLEDRTAHAVDSWQHK